MQDNICMRGHNWISTACDEIRQEGLPRLSRPQLVTDETHQRVSLKEMLEDGSTPLLAIPISLNCDHVKNCPLKGEKKLSKNWVYLIILCRKESGDPCYLQESLPLYSRCIFLRVEVWDTSREFKVSAFQLGWSPLRSSACSAGVAGVCLRLCVFNLCNSSVSLGPPPSVCQLAGITFPALPVPFLACYANDLMTNAFRRWGEGGAEGKETPDFIPIPRCVWISLSLFLTFFCPTAHKHKVGLMPTILLNA